MLERGSTSGGAVVASSGLVVAVVSPLQVQGITHQAKGEVAANALQAGLPSSNGNTVRKKKKSKRPGKLTILIIIVNKINFILYLLRYSN